MLVEELGTFMKFFDENVKGAALTSGAQKNIKKANAKFEELKALVAPPAAAASDEESPSAPATETEQEEEEPQSEMIQKE